MFVNYTVNDTTTFSEGISNGFIASYRAEGSVGNFQLYLYLSRLKL